MVCSMTGYGRSQKSLNGKCISVEIKAVNHRYFEFNSKTPRGYGFLEEKMKNFISQRVFRGKIDVLLSIIFDEASESEVKVNLELAGSYLTAAEKLSRQENIKNDITVNSLLKLQDIFTVEKVGTDEESLEKDVLQVCGEALDGFCAMRSKEGEKLAEDIREKLKNIDKLVGIIETASPATVSSYRERLYTKMQEILKERSLDEGRILTEAALYAEKIAVDEETVRLRSHLSQFQDILGEDIPVGRKLDFLTQEINREVNTIGSKAQDISIAKAVIDLKGEIEKIREQIQNLE